MDDDRSGKLNLSEFSKAMRELRIGLQSNDIQKLFKAFDINNDNEISYPEFFKIICGDMNEFRKQLVDRVYDKLDRNHDGTVTIDDIKDVYNASKHPDVMTKRKTENEILSEFLDTFEQHYSIIVRCEIIK